MKNKYSLRKSFKILHQLYKDYKKKQAKLNSSEKLQLQTALKKLQEAIFKKNKSAASQAAKELEKLSAIFLKKSFLEKTINFILSLSIALVIAIVIRQMWFENYTIPSGSMRPTFKEKDFVVVSKTNFALNKPTVRGHFYFNEKLLSHGDTIVFTTAGMDIANNDHMYFFILPGKKQYVKRLIGKPGDVLYFYGGQIYGFDKNGNRIEAFQKQPYLADIEHIPFIRFEGKIIPFDDQYLLYQMNMPLVRLRYHRAFLFSNNSQAIDYYQLWGIENFAQSQIVQKNNQLFLELSHHPTIDRVIFENELFLGTKQPKLLTETSYLPLDHKHLKKIFQHITTCRFHVKNGFAHHLGSRFYKFDPYLGKIPNGTYEILDGIAYKVNPLGITVKLSASHPLCQYSEDLAITLYNLGIEMNTLYLKKNQTSLSPSRYAYFKDGNLILMNHVIFKKDNSVLKAFVEKEKEKTRNSQSIGFFDPGPPLKPNGKLDFEKIKKYGLHIPEKHYLALGDNHAMSADSRDFGFVPEENLRGNPSFIFWPISNRFGTISQPNHPAAVFPKIFVWSGFGLFLISYWIHRKRKETNKLKF